MLPSRYRIAANGEGPIVGMADLESLVLAVRDRVNFCSNRATLAHGPNYE